MIKICFLIVALIIHALNTLLECIEGKRVFQIGEQFKVVFSLHCREK